MYNDVTHYKQKAGRGRTIMHFFYRGKDGTSICNGGWVEGKGGCEGKKTNQASL